MYRKYLLIPIVFLVVACVSEVQVSPTVEMFPATAVEIPVMEEALASITPASALPDIAWSTYSNDQFGISFEYPAVYDLPSNQDCGVKVSSLPDGTEISIGYRSFLLIQSSSGVGLQEYVDTLIAQKQWRLDSQENVLLGGENAIRFDYRFGGSRFGTATVAIYNNKFYVFNFTAGIFCDIPEANLNEGYAYEHWLESLKFSR